MKTLLVTGGAGFIGGNYVLRSLEQDSDLRIVNLDLLTYAGNLDTLDSLRGWPGDGVIAALAIARGCDRAARLCEQANESERRDYSEGKGVLTAAVGGNMAAARESKAGSKRC